MLHTLEINGRRFDLRPLAADDDISALTALLRAAYQQVAAMGLRFTATWQDDSVTLERAQRGGCYVLTEGRRLAATITLEPQGRSIGSPWFDRPDVASFHQFGVLPELQGLGVGSFIMTAIEARAAAIGARELALDTAEPARHLVSFYERRGYRLIEHVQWDTTNYRSVILSKTLL